MTKSAPAAATRWRGIPAAERKAERRRLLIDAAFDSLGTNGLAGTTVRGVCEATQLNPRYFYESFEDLDELLVAVFDETAGVAFEVLVHAIEPYAAAALAGGAEPDAHALTHAGISAFIHHVTEDPRRARVLFIEGLGNEALSRRRMESMRNLAAAMEQDAALNSATGRAEPVVVVAAHLVVGGMSELMIAWLDGGLDLSLDELIDHAAALFVAVSEETKRRMVDPPGRRGTERATD